MVAPDCEPLCQFGDRLFFTTFPHPPPSSTAINKLAAIPGNEPPLRPRSSPHGNATYHYFTIDDRLQYFSFFEDWGPLNIAMVYKACILIHELLEEADPKQRIVLYSSDDPRRKANAALLVALYAMIVGRRAPWEAFQPIAEMEFIPFRDAGRGPSDFNLNIQDCLWGIWKAMQNGLCDMNDFDVEDYEYYEKVEHGDWNWISPHFVAFASPVDPNWIKKEKESKEKSRAESGTPTPGRPKGSPNSSTALQRKLPVPFLNCLDYFEKHAVKMVVRLNNQLYDRTTFLDRGIDHMELYFDDGTNPTDEIVRKFLDVADRVIENGGVVAVHCKAGLGRTGTLIGAYLVWKYGFTANEAIAFMRIVRPGSVVGPQQQYLYLKQLEWSKWAAVDEMQKQQRTAAAAAVVTPAVVTPATPPADTDEEMSRINKTPPLGSKPVIIPPVTPSRHVAAAAAKAKAIATPGQPRKTPSTKRMAQDSDEDESDDDLPMLGMAPTRAQVKPMRSTGSKATASEQKPTRVTRATATRKLPTSPVKASGQGPNKIPRLATTKTPAAAKAFVAAQQAQAVVPARRTGPAPTPSRLPSLIPKRPQHKSTLSEVASGAILHKGAPPVSDAWMTSNVSCCCYPWDQIRAPRTEKSQTKKEQL
ncbi:phosphatases II [Mycena floridula]|nr:phosphatases II [Mycena floridula]